MSKSRFNRKNAKAQPPAGPTFTREMKHSALFRKAWSLMCGDKALATVQGIIPRRARRDMARTLSKRKPE